MIFEGRKRSLQRARARPVLKFREKTSRNFSAVKALLRYEAFVINIVSEPRLTRGIVKFIIMQSKIKPNFFYPRSPRRKKSAGALKTITKLWKFGAIAHARMDGFYLGDKTVRTNLTPKHSDGGAGDGVAGEQKALARARFADNSSARGFTSPARRLVLIERRFLPPSPFPRGSRLRETHFATFARQTRENPNGLRAPGRFCGAQSSELRGRSRVYTFDRLETTMVFAFELWRCYLIYQLWASKRLAEIFVLTISVEFSKITR